MRYTRSNSSERPGIPDYLRDRYVGRGWSERRLGAELGVGHGWLDGQLARFGLRP